MSVTYGDIRKRVLQLLDEYSSRGSVITAASKIGDIKLKIQGLVNDAIYDLATSTAKIPDVFYIAHSPIKNNLNEDTSSIKQHLPGTDFSITLVGGKATFFEAIGPATVVIEESDDDGETYSEIETITIASSVTDFTEYRRLINPADDENTVRLRFTGDYFYLFRNYVLYPYTWPDEDSVQQFRPWFEYSLPADFMEINYVEVKRDARQYLPYSNHRLRPDNKIAFNRYDSPMELLVHFWRKPTLLTFTGTEAIDDAQVVDLRDEAAMIIPYSIAGQILNSEKQVTEGTLLINQYEVKKENLPTNKSEYKASTVALSGWW